MELIGLLSSGYFISIFLFEIPTGMIADKWGRKFSIILSMLFKALGIFLVAISVSTLQLFIAFCLWGIGMTMSSGAEEAWLYDEIKERKDKDKASKYYQKIYGVMVGIGLFSTAFANAAGGFLFTFSHQLPIILTSVIFLIAAIILMTIPENTKNDNEKATKEKTKMALGVLKKPELILLIIISVTVGALISSVIYWMQPFLGTVRDIQAGAIGLVLGLGIVFASIGSNFNTKMTELFHSYSLPFMIILFAAGFYFIPIFGFWGILFLFLLIRLVRGAFNPYMSTLLNNSFDSSYRATALSLISSVTTLSIGLSMWISGRMIDKISFDIFFIGATVILLLVTLPVSFLYRKYQQKNIKA